MLVFGNSSSGENYFILSLIISVLKKLIFCISPGSASGYGPPAYACSH